MKEIGELIQAGRQLQTLGPDFFMRAIANAAMRAILTQSLRDGPTPAFMANAAENNWTDEQAKAIWENVIAHAIERE